VGGGPTSCLYVHCLHAMSPCHARPRYPNSRQTRPRRPRPRHVWPRRSRHVRPRCPCPRHAWPRRPSSRHTWLWCSSSRHVRPRRPRSCLTRHRRRCPRLRLRHARPRLHGSPSPLLCISDDIRLPRRVVGLPPHRHCS
jgi:hypothetical protein